MAFVSLKVRFLCFSKSFYPTELIFMNGCVFKLKLLICLCIFTCGAGCFSYFILANYLIYLIVLIKPVYRYLAKLLILSSKKSNLELIKLSNANLIYNDCKYFMYLPSPPPYSEIPTTTSSEDRLTHSLDLRSL